MSFQTSRLPRLQSADEAASTACIGRYTTRGSEATAMPTGLNSRKTRIRSLLMERTPRDTRRLPHRTGNSSTRGSKGRLSSVGSRASDP